MFEHASGFQIHNGRFNHVGNGTMHLNEDRSHTSIVGSGNSYNTNYSNSFNDNSRREYFAHHEATHHHGPVHNISSAGNINLGDNYGTFTQEHNVGDTEPWEEYSDDDEDSFPTHEPRAYPGHPSYDSHGQRHFPHRAQDHPSPFPPQDGRGRPFPGSPHTAWGSRNPYSSQRSDHYGFDQPSSRAPPPPPPPRSAPPGFSGSYPRSNDGRNWSRNASPDSERPPYESRRGYRQPPSGRSEARRGNSPEPYHDRPRSSQHPSGEYAMPSRQGARPSYGRDLSRSPSPQYDARQREDRRPRDYEVRERLPSRRHRDEFDPIGRAMDSVDRATAKFSRMGL